MEAVPALPPSKDEEHLKLLVIFHYVVAGIGALFACLPLIHVAIGVMMVMNPESLTGAQNQPPPPAALGYLFVGIGAALVLAGWALAICTFISGRFISGRRNRMFSFVTGAVLCTMFPFGTALGIFTIIVLGKESVQRLYSTS